MLGGALGLAVRAAVANGRSGDLLRSGSTPLAAQVGGLQIASLLAAAAAFAASLVAVFALQRGKVDAVPEASAAPAMSP
jgi:hypothetical protein